MPRPDPRRPREGQHALFDAPTTQDDILHRRGRHSAAFAKALDTAYDQGHIDDIDGALATTLMAAAYSLDQFEAQNKPYGPTKLVDQIVTALREAHMTPDSRPTGDTDAALMTLVQELSETDTTHA